MIDEKDYEVGYMNINRSNKWLGIIEYKVLFAMVIYLFIIFQVLMQFNFKINTFIYVYAISVIPCVIVGILNFDDENAFFIIYIIIKFYITRSIYTLNLQDQELIIQNHKFIVK
ncbi:MAG: hypothetical protein RR922_04745 [Clostridia bacterium]